MKKITLEALFNLTHINIKSIIILGEGKEEIKTLTLSILKKYGNYEVVEITTFMESTYNDMFKITTVESAVRVVLLKGE